MRIMILSLSHCMYLSKQYNYHSLCHVQHDYSHTSISAGTSISTLLDEAYYNLKTPQNSKMQLTFL